MDPNHTIIAETSHLSHDELLLEYEKLGDQYLELRRVNEESLQKIHELKRNLQVSLAAESYLSQELEAATTDTSRCIDEITHRLQTQIDDFKIRNVSLSTANVQLETRMEEVIRMNEDFEGRVKELMALQEKPIITRVDGDTEKEIELERRINELTKCVLEAKQSNKSSEIVNKNLQLEIGYLLEKLNCADENLNQKRHILEEKDALIDSLHEQIVDLSSELAELKNTPDLGSKYNPI